MTPDEQLDEWARCPGTWDHTYQSPTLRAIAAARRMMANLPPGFTLVKSSDGGIVVTCEIDRDGKVESL